jgi:dihydroorotase
VNLGVGRDCPTILINKAAARPEIRQIKIVEGQTERTVLRGGRVIDPAQGIDGIANVMIAKDKIAAITALADSGDATVIDVHGCCVSPGWIDIHVHAFGTLGFADPDSIGIYQGTTSFVEAGGPGIGTFEEFLALMSGRTATDLYVGLYFRPMGIIGLNYIEGEVRNLIDFPIAQWIDLSKANRDILRYLKIGAFGSYGTGPLKIGKGLAEIVGLPLYVHIGEFQQKPDQLSTTDIFRIAEKGDIITHLYHNNLGRILGDDGRVLREVVDAERRGVLFDIGFGGYNFSWDVAEKAFAQGIVPHILSSDLQQFNVNGPTYSLANVLSVFLRLGLTLPEIVERVTINPAKAVRLDDRAGSLRVGMPADVTVFRVVDGEVTLADCHKRTRKADKRIEPVMAFKAGRRFDSDLMRCRDERNWFMQIADDHLPQTAASLSNAQTAFLGTLGAALEDVRWEIGRPEDLDLERATELQEIFHRVRRQRGLPLREALQAVFDSFLDHPFTMQIGLFLLRLERPFALARLNAVAQRQEARS